MPNKNSQYKEMLDYMISSRQSCYTWITRKEIATWAALVLYFTFFFTVFNIIKDSKDTIFLLIVLLSFLLISLLFMLFIFKHCGSLINEIALHHTLSYWIIKIINEKGIPNNFNPKVNEGDIYPKSIRIDMNDRYKKLRNKFSVKKLFLPIKLVKNIFNKNVKDKKYNEYHSTAVQEIIIYDMIFTLIFSFIVYILLKIV